MNSLKNIDLVQCPSIFFPLLLIFPRGYFNSGDERKIIFTQRQCYFFHFQHCSMNALVNSSYSRTRTSFRMRDSGRISPIPCGDREWILPRQNYGSAAVRGSRRHNYTPVQPVSRDIPDHAIPVRICPHCGHEMRTWIHGDLSCTRCENDLRPGEGMGSTFGYQAPGVY